MKVGVFAFIAVVAALMAKRASNVAAAVFAAAVFAAAVFAEMAVLICDCSGFLSKFSRVANYPSFPLAAAGPVAATCAAPRAIVSPLARGACAVERILLCTSSRTLMRRPQIDTAAQRAFRAA